MPPSHWDWPRLCTPPPWHPQTSQGLPAPWYPVGVGPCSAPEALLTGSSVTVEEPEGRGWDRSARPLLFTVLSFTAPVKREPREAAVKGRCVCALRPSRACYKRWGRPELWRDFCHQQFGLGWPRARGRGSPLGFWACVCGDSSGLLLRANSAVWGWGQGRALHILILSILLEESLPFSSGFLLVGPWSHRSYGWE